MKPDDIISYARLVTAEAANLQKGMNFGIGKHYSVFLMSLRKGAPYADALDEKTGTLIYEGHDQPRGDLSPEPRLPLLPRIKRWLFRWVPGLWPLLLQISPKMSTLPRYQARRAGTYRYAERAGICHLFQVSLHFAGGLDSLPTMRPPDQHLLKSRLRVRPGKPSHAGPRQDR